MLIGHVDHLSHRGVNGWAADSDRPDVMVEVSIFTDGCKQAQLACTLARPDLGQVGIGGEGRHGFRFNFPVPLERNSLHHVSVRFTATGRQLVNGEMQLSPDGSTTAAPARSQDDVDGLLGLPAPATPSDLFLLFPFYDPIYGLTDLLARVDFTGRQPRAIRYAALGTLSAGTDQDGELGGATYAPRDHLYELLTSDAFQRELVALLLDAFPEKRRLLFVHIPKCAGSDLSRHLRTRYPSLEQRLMDPHSASKEELFVALRDLVPSLALFDCIFVRGHISLDWYLDRDLVRPIDRLFAIIREPVEIAVSQANYVMTRIAEDLERGKVGQDTRQWLTQLGLDNIPLWPLTDLAEHVCRKALRTPEIVTPNPLCHWLGGGDAATVLDRLAESGAEVTVTAHYNRWLLGRWGIASSSRANESRKFIRQPELSRDEHDHLIEISAEDSKLFGLVQQRLTGLGRDWLSGSQLRPAIR